jgi:hypothetical protein
MTRRTIDPLRPLTPKEYASLEHPSRSRAAPAAQVARTKALRAVVQGASCTTAARPAGRRSRFCTLALRAQHHAFVRSVGGPYLNMAESIQRILRRRALDGQQPKTPDEAIAWLSALFLNASKQSGAEGAEELRNVVRHMREVTRAAGLAVSKALLPTTILAQASQNERDGAGGGRSALGRAGHRGGP